MAAFQRSAYIDLIQRVPRHVVRKKEAFIMDIKKPEEASAASPELTQEELEKASGGTPDAATGTAATTTGGTSNVNTNRFDPYKAYTF